MENDSTQRLYRDWLQKCLSSSSQDATVSTVSHEAHTAFGLFAQASCNLDEKVALLLQELGPAFRGVDEKSSMKPLLAALNCFSGALEGIGIKRLSLATGTLLGKFLLEFCGPIQLDDEYSDDDVEDKIRDAAVKALCLLLKSVNVYDHLLIDDLEKYTASAIRICLQLGQSGVERRCASSDAVIEEDDDDYERERRNRDGLSLLPRSRRSLCFDLLRSSVESVQVDQSPLWPTEAASIEKDLIKFATFVSTCLHGESDPRCLLQLLELFYLVMTSFVPYYTVLQSPTFPLSDFFDAVAPYYPVQFTPPPNNVYGITKTTIRNAVLAVLSFSGLDDLAEKFNNESMRSFALGIIVEALLPPEEDGPQTIKEKLEALEDLRLFLFANEKSKIPNLSVREAKQLSDTLVIVHNEASNGVASKSATNEEGKSFKKLADLCRLIVSRISLETEENDNSALWDAFVMIPISTMSSSLQLSISQARVNIAYLANLCSCGGIATLRIGLEAGLAPILKNSFDDNSLSDGDDDALCTAVWAVGAFFASARVTMEKLQLNGVYASPHPLLGFSGPALQAMFRILLDEHRDIQIRVAAIRALEAIVTVTPPSQVSPSLLTEWDQFIRAMTARLFIQECSLGSEKQESDTKWLRCGAEILGVFIGMALDSRSTVNCPAQNTVFYIIDIQAYLVNDVLNMLVQSIRSNSSRNSDLQLELNALAKACSVSAIAAFDVVSVLMKQLLSAAENGDSSTISYAECLAFLFKQNNAAQVFQNLDSPAINVFDIISTLCPSLNEDSTMDVDGMSKLQLPPNADEKEKFRTRLVLAEAVVSQLRSAYEFIVVDEHLEKLARFVGNCLPPLSDTDFAKTCISLPLLSLALHNCDQVSCRKNLSLCNVLQSMCVDLADLATNSTNIGCRVHATQCLYVSIAYFSHSTSDCPAKLILDNVVLAAKATISNAKLSKNVGKERDFSDILTLLAVLGAAAITRGGSSYGTSDLIMLFLLDLACKKVSDLPFNDESAVVDLKVFDDANSNISDLLSLHAANSFGLMLASIGGGPLCKQRCSHVAMKHIQNYVQGNNSKIVSTGALCAACHVVCVGTMTKLSSKTMKMISEIVLSGLRSDSLENLNACSPSTTKLILSSLIRIYSVMPSAFDGLQYCVVVGAMRAISETGYDNSDAGIACKLLALQILDIVAKQGGSDKVKSKMKTAVVSILGVAVNHPSALFRQGAVEVRNTWFLLA